MISPQSRYKEIIAEQQLAPDSAQLDAIAKLDALHHELKVKEQSLSLSAEINSPSITPLKGIYLHGPVGRGKSLLLNIFFECLPDHLKLRLHFHRFMARVHRDLREASGMKEPLEFVADSLAQESKVLCFDEFFVSDIGDAMILYRLFNALFNRGVTLVATSNISIKNLYQDGLHRKRFEPAIELLQNHLQQMHLDGPVDYRFSHEIFLPTYFISGEEDFSTLFESLIGEQSGKQQGETTIQICHRDIEIVSASKQLVWFNFSAICEGPRSHLDYMELADRFNTIIITGVPAFSGEVTNRIKARGTEDSEIGLSTGERTVLAANHDNAARRFISLVDEFYDQGTLLYVSAEVPLTDLYLNGILSEEFNRTRSRLMEMQSEKYIKANQTALNNRSQSKL
ncbi:MAG: cell division protein ZapE [Candidatus Azotimanducaceae bacterium]|jgi:cell division protein ZapE